MTVTWPKIEIFKNQDGGGRHLKNRFYGDKSSTDCPIAAKFCTRKQNGMSTRATRKKTANFLNPIWRTAAILKIVKSPHLSEKSSDFDEIWYTTSNIEPGYRHVTKNWNFLNSRWRWTPSWKSFSGHNSSTDCPISAKFCMRKQNGMSTRATWQKLQIFKIQDGGQPPFWKSLNRHISVKNRPILMKFGTLRQMQIAVSWPKIEIFQIQDGGGRHLENRFFGHNSSTDCLISAKFCMRKQNGMSTRATRQKLQFF